MGLYVSFLSQVAVSALGGEHELPPNGGKVNRQDRLPKGSTIIGAVAAESNTSVEVTYKTNKGEKGVVKFYLPGSWFIDVTSPIEIIKDKNGNDTGIKVKISSSNLGNRCIDCFFC